MTPRPVACATEALRYFTRTGVKSLLASSRECGVCVRSGVIEHEVAIVRRLLAASALPYANLTDPKALYGRETGADVQMEHEGRKIGIQVTDFSVDEAIADPRRGLRATERKNARQGRYPAYWLPLAHDRRRALRIRVLDKIEKARGYTFSEYGEVWLVVGASLALDHAVVSTFLPTMFASLDDLNTDLDAELCRSKYQRAFVHVEVGGTVFEWSRDRRWQRTETPLPGAETMGAEDVIRLVQDPSSVGEVPPHPKAVQMICAECGGPFVRYPRREPMRPDGRHIHADDNWCAHIKRIAVRWAPS
jgi:hypothetical protein